MSTARPDKIVYFMSQTAIIDTDSNSYLNSNLPKLDYEVT